jgi:hypothetical protein
MNTRFGIVRGFSPEDAYAAYVLTYLRRTTKGAVWRPDPVDEAACLRQVERDEDKGDWVLRFSWRQAEPEQVGGAAPFARP